MSSGGPLGKVIYGVIFWGLVVNRLIGIVPAFLHMAIDAFGVVYVGSYYSIYCSKSKHILMRNWYIYPLYATGTLVGVYVLLITIGKDIVNPVLFIYFCILGVFAVKHWTDCVFDSNSWNIHLQYFAISGMTLMYMHTKDWTLNNLIGIAFCLYAVKKVHVGTFGKGIAMLLLFVVYDIVFVFGTDVMVAVATDINGPIKLMYPRVKNYSYLGLADIMVPGVFIAHCLRFDLQLSKAKKQSLKRVYFGSAFKGYVIGYLGSIIASIVLRRPLPALIFLVPCTIGAVIITGLREVQIEKMFAFDEESLLKRKPENNYVKE